MEKFYKDDMNSSNIILNRVFNSISSYASDVNLDGNNYNLNNNSFKMYKNNLQKDLSNSDYMISLNENDKNIINNSTDKIIYDSTINNNDIKCLTNLKNKYKKNNSSNNFIQKNYTKSSLILDNYIIRLKNFGFPDIGEIYLSSDAHEQEKTFNFFDYLISKEANNLEQNHLKEKEYEGYKKQIQDLEYKILNLNQELNNNLKKNVNIRKDLEDKLEKQKQYYEQKLSLLNKDKEYLSYVNNKIYFKKKNLELKLYTMNKTINKFENMKSNIINAVEAIDYVQNNDMAKMLTRVKGAEKLIESLKGGYNNSLKELTLEVSLLKNLIYEIHSEICVLLDNPYDIENNVYDMAFSESIEYLKKIFKNNINLLKEKIENIGNKYKHENIY